MRQHKEHYRRKLPHFQQPGQWYSVTFTLVGAMPKGAMDNYSLQLEIARNRLDELLGQGIPESDVFLEGKANDFKLAKLESRESDFPKSDLKIFDLGKSKSQNQGLLRSANFDLGKLKSQNQGLLCSESFDLGKSKSQNQGLLRSESFDLGKSKSQNQGLLCSENFDLGKSKSQLEKAKKDYQIAQRKYCLAFDKIFNTSNSPDLPLIKEMNRKVIEEALLFWEGKRLTNHAWCIMSNHVHWVLSVSKNGENGKPVYLEDILHSVKLFTARRINENEGKTGQFWEHESFDTTIRDERHFSNVLNYVINNPVTAGLVADWRDWPGTRVF